MKIGNICYYLSQKLKNQPLSSQLSVWQERYHSQTADSFSTQFGLKKKKKISHALN